MQIRACVYVCLSGRNSYLSKKKFGLSSLVRKLYVCMKVYKCEMCVCMCKCECVCALYVSVYVFNLYGQKIFIGNFFYFENFVFLDETFSVQNFF